MIYRKITDLDPSFRASAQNFLNALDVELKSPASPFAIAGVKGFVILETKRELPIQMAYATRGRMPSDWVKAYFKKANLWQITDAEAAVISTWTLDSKHLDGKALDVAPSKDFVTPFWNAPDAVWDKMAAIAEACGLIAGRNWKGKQDSPHFEMK